MQTSGQPFWGRGEPTGIPENDAIYTDVNTMLIRLTPTATSPSFIHR